MYMDQTTSAHILRNRIIKEVFSEEDIVELVVRSRDCWWNSSIIRPVVVHKCDWDCKI